MAHIQETRLDWKEGKDFLRVELGLRWEAEKECAKALGRGVEMGVSMCTVQESALQMGVGESRQREQQGIREGETRAVGRSSHTHL